MSNPLDIALQRGKVDMEELRYNIWGSKEKYNDLKKITTEYKENGCFYNPGLFELSRKDQFGVIVEKTIKRRELMNMSHKTSFVGNIGNFPDEFSGGVGFYPTLYPT